MDEKMKNIADKQSKDYADLVAQKAALKVESTKATQNLADAKKGAELVAAVDAYARDPSKFFSDLAKAEKEYRDVLADTLDADNPAVKLAENNVRNIESLRLLADSERKRQAAISFNNAQKFANTVGMGTDYLAKWAFDKGALDFMTFDFPALSFMSPDGFKKSLCNDLAYDIKDNDDGIIFDASSQLRVVSTFGTEMAPIENEAGKSYAYITAAYVTNPENENARGSDFLMTIDFKNLKSCMKSPCPTQYSLTNNESFNLSVGTSFASGNGPRTNIVYLPGEYGTVCITFDKLFPNRDNLGKREYCRTIKERTFETGTALPEVTTNTGTTSAAVRANALQGWS
jgi:hypothetical protein